jgi:hypothetical protein
MREQSFTPPATSDSRNVPTRPSRPPPTRSSASPPHARADQTLTAQHRQLMPQHE